MGSALIVPKTIVGYRIITSKGTKIEQVLVDWKGLPESEQSWEDLRWVVHLNPNANLEDKVRSASEGDIIVVIDQAMTEGVLGENWDWNKTRRTERKLQRNPIRLDRRGTRDPRVILISNILKGTARSDFLS